MYLIVNGFDNFFYCIKIKFFQRKEDYNAMQNKNAIEEISKLELKKEASIGQDYVDNKLIYGVKIKWC